MSGNTIYLVPEHTLRDLINDSNKLTALECGGVDNWDWYGYSISDYVADFRRNNQDLVKEVFGEDEEDFGIEEMSELELMDYSTVEDLYTKTIEILEATL